MVGAIFSLIYLTVAAVVASGTLAWCNSRGSSVTNFQAAKGTEVFELQGSFDENYWLDGRGSGFYVTNLTDSDLWVYFTASGNLQDLVRPVNPIRLTAGERAEIPLVVEHHNDLALLAWRNQNKVFTGNITARAYNNFVSCECEEIRISATRLYDRLAGGQERRVGALVAGRSNVTGDLTLEDIGGIDDLQRLLVQNSTRGQELERLQEETQHQYRIIAALEDRIGDLIEDNTLLGSLVESLKSRPESHSPSDGSDSSDMDQGGDTEAGLLPIEPPATTEPDTPELQPSEPEEVLPEEPVDDGSDQEATPMKDDQPVVEELPVTQDPPTSDD